MYLSLHLTTACNLRCSYCYSPPHDGAHMSQDVANRALEFGLEASGGKACGIIFFGGEPLLRKETIFATVARARELEAAGRGSFTFRMTTNGLLLDDAMIDYCVKERIQVALSIDGVAAAHDRHRIKPDGGSSWAFVRDRLDALLAKKPASMVISIVNPDTVPYLVASVEELLHAGAEYLLLSLNYGASWTEADFKALRKQYRRLARKYIKWTQAGKKFFLSPFDHRLASHINKGGARHDRCELARHQLSVDPQGFLFPCVQFPKAGPDSEWCVGNIFDGIDAARRQRLTELSRDVKEDCVDCALVERCHNTCGCLNWQTTGDVNRVPGELCRHEQVLLPIVDRVGAILYRKRDPHFLKKHYRSA